MTYAGQSLQVRVKLPGGDRHPLTDLSKCQRAVARLPEAVKSDSRVEAIANQPSHDQGI